MTEGPGWTPPEQGAGSSPTPPPPGYGGYGGSGQAPPPPGYGGYGGYGGPWPPPGYGGYGAPWPPPAPKPGVIPLRPVSMGEILDGSIATIRRNPKATLGFTAVVMVASTAITTFLAA